MVTTTKRTTGETAQRTVGDAQLYVNTAAEYASRTGEINAEVARRTVELWLEGFRKQTELSRKTARRYFETVEERARVEADSPGRSFPFTWVPYAFGPFALWRESARGLQEALRETSERTAGGAPETARAVQVTAPGNVTFPIAGYDEKNVGEISRRLDTLTDEQLRRVKDYERRNKNRETLIQEIDRKIAAAS